MVSEDQDSVLADGGSIAGSDADTQSLVSSSSVAKSKSPDENGEKKSEDDQPPVEQKVSKRRPGKATEIPLFERRNWLLHLHYVRKEYAICKALINEILTESENVCEYAMYVKALILREEGMYIHSSYGNHPVTLFLVRTIYFLF